MRSGVGDDRAQPWQCLSQPRRNRHMRGNCAHPGAQTAEQRIEKHRVLRHEQQGARLLIGAR